MDVIYRKQRLALTRFWGDNRLCLRATEPEQIEMPKMQFVGGHPNEWYIFIDDLTDEGQSCLLGAFRSLKHGGHQL